MSVSAALLHPKSFLISLRQTKAEYVFLAIVAVFCICGGIVASHRGLHWPFLEIASSYWVASAIVISVFVPVATYVLAKGRLSAALIRSFALNLLTYLSLIPFLIAFSQIKTGIYLFPGWNFDPQQAAIDKMIHFGRDAWEMYQPVLSVMSFADASYAYHGLWAASLNLGPAIAMAIDRDRARVKAGIACYLFIWIGLGIGLAALFHSFGPAFYGSILGDDGQFATLAQEQARGDFSSTMFSHSVQWLTQEWDNGLRLTGAGISAFPSIHVAMATLSAIYLASVSRWLLVPGLVYLAVIQVFSVLSGLHYAIDGYVSIIAVALTWLYFRRYLFLKGTAEP